MNLNIPVKELTLMDALNAGEFGQVCTSAQMIDTLHNKFHQVYRGQWLRSSGPLICAIKIFKQNGTSDVSSS